MAPQKKHYKLVITIVKKKQANKVVSAAKRGGAEGGTILLGSGLGIREKESFFGIDLMYEKEIVLTLIPEDRLAGVLEQINHSAKLYRKGTGLGFVLDVLGVRGIVHSRLDLDLDEEALDNMPGDNVQFELIVTIVNKGDAGTVVDASRRAGAEGGTILSGRGSGIHEQAKLLAMIIEPEKEIVLTLVTRDKVRQVLHRIEEEAGLNQPGKGIAFILPVEETIGINH
ncbi:P-II family nitrogen regulator [Alteribacter natronophilus]|uniref:P-II family nitrogen regulator n=1 Tax=Alteribacter natronophilus TaxID=2583810 RepID=UPI00110D67AE|nr:P-II family nitrogen regulator [Alteribacter natronophilus]TMW70325.1 PII family protein [Alteribacter natronophilus]